MDCSTSKSSKMAQAADAGDEETELCQLYVSKKTYKILETMMSETKLSCEELLEALFKLYRSLKTRKENLQKSQKAGNRSADSERFHNNQQNNPAHSNTGVQVKPPTYNSSVSHGNTSSLNTENHGTYRDNFYPHQAQGFENKYAYLKSQEEVTVHICVPSSDHQSLLRCTSPISEAGNLQSVENISVSSEGPVSYNAPGNPQRLENLPINRTLPFAVYLPAVPVGENSHSQMSVRGDPFVQYAKPPESQSVPSMTPAGRGILATCTSPISEVENGDLLMESEDILARCTSPISEAETENPAEVAVMKPLLIGGPTLTSNSPEEGKKKGKKRKRSNGKKLGKKKHKGDSSHKESCRPRSEFPSQMPILSLERETREAVGSICIAGQGVNQSLGNVPASEVGTNDGKGSQQSEEIPIESRTSCIHVVRPNNVKDESPDETTQAGEIAERTDYRKAQSREIENITVEVAEYTSEDRPFECGRCHARFKLRHHLNNHMNVHSLSPSHECQECGKTFKSVENLKRHAKKHNPSDSMFLANRFTCKDCNYRGESASDLKKHSRRHTQDKCFKCDLCSFSTIWKKNLKDHMSRHARFITVLKCHFKMCDYVTHSKPALRFHIKAKHSPKPVCEYCGQEFSTQGFLKQHIHSHTNEKPYKCNLCDYRTAFQANLRTHRLIHEPNKRFVCLQCDQKFTQKNHLKAHFQALHAKPDKEYTCSQCSFVGKSSQGLNSHKRKHKKKSAKDHVKEKGIGPGEIRTENSEGTCKTDGLCRKSKLEENSAEVNAAQGDPTLSVNTVPETMHSDLPLAGHCNAKNVKFQPPANQIYPQSQNVKHNPHSYSSCSNVNALHGQPQVGMPSDLNSLQSNSLGYQSGLNSVVLNMEGLNQPQPSGSTYSSYTVHHLVAP